MNRLRLAHTTGLLSLTRGTRAMSDIKGSSRPINLVTVNTFPDRAKTVVGTVLVNIKDRYNIVHAGNADRIDGVKPLLESIQPPPGILFCASMWTPEEQIRIQQIAKDTIPGIRTHAAPSGLQAQAGVEGVVKHLSERIDEIMRGL